MPNVQEHASGGGAGQCTRLGVYRAFREMSSYLLLTRPLYVTRGGGGMRLDFLLYYNYFKFTILVLCNIEGVFLKVFFLSTS